MVETSDARPTTPPFPTGAPALGGRIWIVIALLATLMPLAYMYMGRRALNPDPYIYSQIAKQFLAGDKLYTEIVIDKGPLVPLFYAIPQLVVERSLSAVAFFGGLVISAYALIFAWAFRATPKAAIACLLVALVAPLSHPDWAWFSTEHATNLFVALSLVICLKICRSNQVTTWDAVWTGALPILALNTRQPAVMLMLAPLIVLFVTKLTMRTRMRAAGVALASGAVTLGLVLVFVWLVTDLRSYYYYMVEFPQKYKDWPTVPYNPRVKLLTEFFSHPFGYFSLACFVGAMTTRYRALALASVVSGLAICLLPRKEFSHYMMSFLPAVVLCAGLTFERWKDCGRAIWLAALLLGFQTIHRAYMQLDASRYLPTALAQAEVAAKVDEVAPPGATLTVWAPQMTMMEPIVFTSELWPANKNCWMFMLQPPFTMIPTTTPPAELLVEYMQSPPGVLVVHDATLNFVSTANFDPERYDLRLLKLLLDTQAYVTRTKMNDYFILLRRPGATTAPTTSQSAFPRR